MNLSDIKNRLSSIKLPGLGESESAGSGLGRSATPVGLDMGGQRIKLAALKPGGGPPRLTHLIERPVPQGVVRGTRVVDTEAMSDELHRIIDETGIRGPEIALHIGGGDVQVKRVAMQRMAREEALRQVPTHPQLKAASGDVEGMQYDLVILDPQAEGASMDVLAVTAKKDVVEARQKAVMDAGAIIHAVDVDALALFNVFAHCFPDRKSGRVVLLHIGHESSMIVVLNSGAPALVRHIYAGVGNLIEQVGRGGGAMGGDAAREALFTSNPAVIYPGAFGEWVGSLSEEVHRSARAIARGESDPVGAVYLSGGGALMEGLASQIEERLRAPVHMLDPLEVVPQPEGFRPQPAQQGVSFALAIGLALRQVD